MLEAGPAPGHQLTTDEDGGHHPRPRHGLHDVHHPLPVLASLVHLHALELCAEVIQCLLQEKIIFVNSTTRFDDTTKLTLATVQYEQ